MHIKIRDKSCTASCLYLSPLSLKTVNSLSAEEIKVVSTSLGNVSLIDVHGLPTPQSHSLSALEQENPHAQQTGLYVAPFKGNFRQQSAERLILSHNFNGRFRDVAAMWSDPSSVTPSWNFPTSGSKPPPLFFPCVFLPKGTSQNTSVSQEWIVGNALTFFFLLWVTKYKNDANNVSVS